VANRIVLLSSRAGDNSGEDRGPSFFSGFQRGVRPDTYSPMNQLLDSMPGHRSDLRTSDKPRQILGHAISCVFKHPFFSSKSKHREIILSKHEATSNANSRKQHQTT